MGGTILYFKKFGKTNHQRIKASAKISKFKPSKKNKNKFKNDNFI
jgi:hypothetical protein